MAEKSPLLTQELGTLSYQEFFDNMYIDVTEIVQRYRLALRNVWNTSIWVEPSLRNWESVYAFRSLKLPLFRTLVANQLDIDGDELFGNNFQVVPEEEGGFTTLQINSRVPSRPDEGIWSPLKGAFKAADLKLTLIDLFDWSPLGYLDLRYYVVRIDEFRDRPGDVGQHAMADVNQWRVVFAPRENSEFDQGLDQA